MGIRRSIERDTHDTVAITSAVCAPAVKGQAHTVLSCVVTDEAHLQEALDCRISTAPDLEQGAIRGCQQALELLQQSITSGLLVSGVHCSHCPTPCSPKCGPLARLPRCLR